MTGHRSTAIKLLALTPLFMSGVVLADDYRGDVRLDYQRTDYDGDPLNFDAFTLSGSWYFAPVKTDGVPLSEAAFLGHASYLGASASRADFLGEHLNAYGLTAGVYIPHSIFFVSATATRADELLSISPDTVKRRDTSWSGELGIAPIDGLLLTTHFDEQDYQPNLSARYVSKLPNSHFYAASLDVTDPDLGKMIFGGSFDYYFDSTLSAGVAYSDFGERWTLRGEKFFTPQFSVNASVFDEKFAHGFAIAAAMRF